MDTYKKLIEYEGMLKDGVISAEEFQKLKKMLYSTRMTEVGIQDESEFEEYIKKETFREAVLMLENNTVASYKEAIILLESLKGWGNSNEVITQCKIELEELEKIAEKERLDKEKDKKLNEARKKIESQSLQACQEAIKELKELGSWKDSEALLESASAILPELIQNEENRKAEVEKRKKKISKYIAIAIAAVIGVIAIVAIVNNVIIPGNTYKKALALEEAKQYEEAIDIFKELGDYKDSVDHISSCKYGIATELKVAGKYEAAYKAFAELGDYKDSKDQVNECKYQLAVELKAAENYKDAFELFDTLGSYKDSNNLSNECKYSYASQLKSSGKLEEAYEVFKGLGDYKDSKDQANKCLYTYASGLKSQKQYKEAYEAFALLGDYKDSKNQVNDCKYSYASQLKSSGKFEEAYEVFKGLGDYKDSKDQADVMLKKAAVAQFINSSTGDTVKFGIYEQDNNRGNGKESIEWLVLKKSGGRVLLVSKYVIDAKMLDNDRSKKEKSWRQSELSIWLNKEFYKEAFNDKEKKVIASDVDSSYDKVFVLSWEEAKEYTEDGGILSHAEATEYSKSIESDADDWWVRSIFIGVDKLTGYVVDGSHLSMEEAWHTYGVRPSIWIDIGE